LLLVLCVLQECIDTLPRRLLLRGWLMLLLLCLLKELVLLPLALLLLLQPHH
jgi:hypothetical protein